MSLSQITPTMSTQRLIDRDERTRQKPMRVLVLGMCRTGTTSIAIALRKLGYTFLPNHPNLHYGKKPSTSLCYHLKTGLKTNGRWNPTAKKSLTNF